MKKNSFCRITQYRIIISLFAVVLSVAAAELRFSKLKLAGNQM